MVFKTLSANAMSTLRWEPKPPKGKLLDFYVIEVNARGSRFGAPWPPRQPDTPLAYVAAEISLG